MLTQERLQQLIEYDSETGIAYWKIKRGRSPAGTRVGFILYGSKRSKPYRYVKIPDLGRRSIPFTHVVHLYMTGRWPKAEIDHIHGDTLDDRWSELRESTREQNEANRGARKNNKLGLKGVWLQPSGKYKAEIYRKGEHIYLGMFDTAQEAHAAYLAAAAQHDGEFLRAA